MTIVGLIIIIGVIAIVIYTFKGDLDGIIEKQSEASESTAKSEAIKIEHLKIQQQPVIQWQEGNHEKRFNISFDHSHVFRHSCRVQRAAAGRENYRNLPDMEPYRFGT